MIYADLPILTTFVLWGVLGDKGLASRVWTFAKPDFCNSGLTECNARLAKDTAAVDMAWSLLLSSLDDEKEAEHDKDLPASLVQ